MKWKILFIAIIWPACLSFAGAQPDKAQLAQKKELTVSEILNLREATIDEILNLKQHDIDGAVTASYTDVTVDQMRQQLKGNLEKAARQFGLVREAFDCGALPELGKLVGASDSRLNLNEVMALESADIYKAALLQLDGNVSIDDVRKLKDSEAISLAVQALAQKLRSIAQGDPCGSGRYRRLLTGRWQSPHSDINDSCTLFNLLLSALKDKQASVRVVAARSLGKIEHSSIVEPLILAMKDESIDVRKAAIEVLVKITGKDFGKDPVKWEDWWEKNKQKME